MTTRHRVRAVVTAALVVALSACAGTDATGEATPTPSASPTAPASPADSSPPTPDAPAGQRIEVEVSGGQVSGDTGRVPVPLGEPVTLVVTSDVADEIHVHGYDLTAALDSGGSAQLSFDATVPGVFEVELHDAGTVLLTLQVG